MATSLDWLFSLQVGDKVDILNTGSQLWCIGVINEIEIVNATVYNFNVGYEGVQLWRSSSDLQNKGHEHYRCIKPLHTKTPYHNPNDSVTCWASYYNTTKYLCSRCNRKCCAQCFIVHIYDKKYNTLSQSLCTECYPVSKYNAYASIAHLIFKSIFRDKEIEMNLMKMITEYTLYMSHTVKVSCQMTACYSMDRYAQASKLDIEVSMKWITLISDRFITVCSRCHRQIKNGGRNECRLFNW